MDFVLNDYHRNISKEDLIKDISDVAKKLKKNSITRSEYRCYGKYGSTTVRKKLGSWKTALELANLSTEGHSFRCDYTLEDIKTDIARVLNILGKTTLTLREYQKFGKYNSWTLANKYGWNNILKACSCRIQFIHTISKEEVLAEIERLWISLGRQPTTTDIKKGLSKYSSNTYIRKFGSWRKALQYFVSYINDDKKENARNETITQINPPISLTQFSQNKHQTTRDINLRLRFKVMARDNFKCCLCGASPATDPNVILHIDHIKPWSKGGETTMDNLQTLCSKCNLGKSNLEIKESK